MTEVVRLPADRCVPPPQGSVVTIGTYDGVHRGHRAVIAEVRRRAASAGLVTAVVTFDRHPAEVLRPDRVPRQLTDPEQEIELLASTGVDRVVVLTARPGRLALQVPIDLPRPRSIRMRTLPRFGEILACLQEAMGITT